MNDLQAIRNIITDELASADLHTLAEVLCLIQRIKRDNQSSLITS